MYTDEDAAVVGGVKAELSATFEFAVQAPGTYRIAIFYFESGTRATNVPVLVHNNGNFVGGGLVDQTANAAADGFEAVVDVALAPGVATVTVSNTGTAANQKVVVDAARVTCLAATRRRRAAADDDSETARAPTTMLVLLGAGLAAVVALVALVIVTTTKKRRQAASLSAATPSA